MGKLFSLQPISFNAEDGVLGAGGTCLAPTELEAIPVFLRKMG